jgi:hypothetical protein
VDGGISSYTLKSEALLGGGGGASPPIPYGPPKGAAVGEVPSPSCCGLDIFSLAMPFPSSSRASASLSASGWLANSS